MIRLLGYLFTAGFLVFCAVAIAIGYVIWDKSEGLPTLETLTSYEPPVMTRVHAGDGSLLAEYAEQRRLPCAVQSYSAGGLHCERAISRAGRYAAHHWPTHARSGFWLSGPGIAGPGSR